MLLVGFSLFCFLVLEFFFGVKKWCPRALEADLKESRALKMSSFKVRIVRFPKCGKHPNADTLCIVHILGYQVVMKTGLFREGDWCVYVPADALVPLDHPTFQFLKTPDSSKTHSRIRPRKLRGIFSIGFIIPLPPGTGVSPPEEEEVTKALGITLWEPTETYALDGRQASPPDLFCPIYQIEPLWNSPDAIKEGEMVWITEKIHGCNSRFCVDHSGNFHVGSHSCFWLDSEANVWWKTSRAYPELEQACRENPGWTIYGETYGVQDLKYGLKNGQTAFAAFAVFAGSAWLSPDALSDFCQRYKIPTVPHLYTGPFNLQSTKDLIKLSVLSDHMMEGVVIVSERGAPLKLHGEAYLLRKNGTEAK